MPRPEFQVHKLNPSGLVKANAIGDAFTELLDKLEALVPAGRPKSIALTHLQDACHWAKRGMAELPENQDPPVAF